MENTIDRAMLPRTRILSVILLGFAFLFSLACGRGDQGSGDETSSSAAYRTQEQPPQSDMRQEQIRMVDSIFAFLDSPETGSDPETRGSGSNPSSTPSSEQLPQPGSKDTRSSDRSEQSANRQSETTGQSEATGGPSREQQEQSATTRELSSRSSEPPVEEGATETRSLEFLSEPGRVTVTLRNLETEERFQEVTPATFSVPPGRYQWNAEKDGFESTSANNPVDLRSRQQEVVRLELSPARTAAPAYVQNGNRAYENENYDEAIQYYRQVSPPEDGGKATWYVQTLGRLGEMYWKERQDYAQAIDAYESILDHDPTRYAAHLNLARIAYELDNYTQALRRLDQVDRLRYQIPVDRRTEVSLHARHLRASVLYQQTANAESRRRTVQVGPRALQTLRSFIEAVPSDMEADFQDQLQDAQEKLEEVRTILRTTN